MEFPSSGHRNKKKVKEATVALTFTHVLTLCLCFITLMLAADGSHKRHPYRSAYKAQKYICKNHLDGNT